MHHIVSPDNSDLSIEALIQAKGKVAPRVTPGDVESFIDSEHYFTAGQGVAQATGNLAYCSEPPLNLLTFCVLTLRNGFTVTGESACASPENFDADIGKRIARTNAVQKVWPLLGFLLRERLAEVDALIDELPETT